MDSHAPPGFGTAQSVRRTEDPRLLTGCGDYADDAAAEGALHLVFLRSPLAHAAILDLDTAAALAMPGVIAIITGTDLVAAGLGPIGTAPGFKRIDGAAMDTPPRRALAHEVTRFVGEPLAAVVATSAAAARDAAEAIDLRLEERPAIIDPLAATQPGAPLLWPGAPDNVAAQACYGDAAAVDAAFATAACVVTVDIHNQRLHPVPLEPRAILASHDAATGRTTLRMATQTPGSTRNFLCDDVLGIAREDVRVVVGDIGGGFGLKHSLYPEDAVLAYATRLLGRPVRWRAERSEEFAAGSHGRDVTSRAALAVAADGRVLGLRVRSWAALGAYPSAAGVVIQLLAGPGVTTSVYDIRTIDIIVDGVLTNTMPTAPYRGAGRPEAILLVERLLDEAAAKLGMDPAEIRRRNFIQPAQMPYRNAVGHVYDSGAFERMLDGALQSADWQGFTARAAEARGRGRLRGRGIATFLEWTGGGVLQDRVVVSVGADGMVTAFSPCQAMGQGLQTTYAQLVARVFDLPLDRIRVVHGDTDQGDGAGSIASRSSFVGGTAIQGGAKAALDLARGRAAAALEAAEADLEYAAGRFTIAGTDRAIDLAGLAQTAELSIAATFGVDGASWPNGCHIAEVEIDPETGEVTLAAYVSVNDVGTCINLPIVHGQLDGGIVQGIGQALHEEVVYDRQTGQLLTGSLMDYALPRASDLPDLRTLVDESVPCLTNPLGVKGAGELGTIGATPAVLGAILAALRPLGVREIPMPATAARVWHAIQAANKSQGARP